MRSTQRTAAWSFSFGLAVMAFAATASADTGTPKQASESSQETVKPAVSQEARKTDDHVSYEFKTPQLVYEYDKESNTCKTDKKASPVTLFTSTVGSVTLSLSSVQKAEWGSRFFAQRGARFIIVRTIGGKTDPQLVIGMCQDGRIGAFFGRCSVEQDTPKPDVPNPDVPNKDTSKKDDERAPVRGIPVSVPWLERPERHERPERYYCLEKTAFDAMLADGEIVKKYARTFSGPVYGLNLTLPIKVRRAIPGFNTTVDKDIQIGGFLGARWRISDTSDYYVDLPVAGVGLTTLTIAKGTAPGAMNESAATTGLSASIGVIIELSDFQLGIMMGRDRATGDAGKDWRYNDRTWYSFGFGYSFLKNK